MFWDLTVSLSCEVKTLAYPRAALLSFGVAVAVYNGLQAVKGAIGAAHGPEVLGELSSHTMAEEVGRMWDGLNLVVGAADWARVCALSPGAFAEWLRTAASGMDRAYYRKTPRGPKKPKPKPDGSVPINAQSSTRRFLLERKLLRNKRPPP